MSPQDPLARYRDRAQRVAEEFGPGHSGVDALADAIAQLVHEFVAHDMEWAALAVEKAKLDLAEVLTQDSALVVSIRARGRGDA